MRTELVSGCDVAFSWLLPSVCLRYGVALPSVWLRRRLCKLRQFTNFRSDYPLNLSWFWCPNWSVRETLQMCRFLVLCSGSFSSRTLHRFEWHRLAGVVGYASNDLAYGSVVREAFTDQFVSVHAGQLSSVPCLLRIGARKSSLKPHRKSCLTPPTLSCLIHAHLVVQLGTSARMSGYVSQLETGQPFSFLIRNNDWKKERIAPRLDQHICSSWVRILVDKPSVPNGTERNRSCIQAEEQ